MGKKTVACVQSSYIPWKGYFDQIRMADVFIFYDDVQFTKEDWRNRNFIKTPNGIKPLTIPCGKHINRLICEVEILDDYWQKKHWLSIVHNYTKAKFFKKYSDFFEELYLQKTWNNLSDLNQTFIKKISNNILKTNTEFIDSRDFNLPINVHKEDRWLELLKLVGATNFIIGPSAKNYLDEDKQKKISQKGINLEWMEYSGYPEYHQLFPPFEHHVSIIDLIFNEGDNAINYMKKIY